MYWLNRTVGPLHHKAGIGRANGDLEGYRKHLAPEPGLRKFLAFTDSPCGNEFVGVLYRIGMELACKLWCSLEVKA
eukprot:1157654-Pelagomonas_calceolata.AAC.7